MSRFPTGEYAPLKYVKAGENTEFYSKNPIVAFCLWSVTVDMACKNKSDRQDATLLRENAKLYLAVRPLVV